MIERRTTNMTNQPHSHLRQ